MKEERKKERTQTNEEKKKGGDEIKGRIEANRGRCRNAERRKYGAKEQGGREKKEGNEH